MKNITSNLPENFVYLDQIDSTILHSMIYYDNKNFIGERIHGYKAPRTVLAVQTAIALKDIQQDRSYKLVIIY